MPLFAPQLVVLFFFMTLMVLFMVYISLFVSGFYSSFSIVNPSGVKKLSI